MKHDNDFIMLPTVDFCFKELMQSPKVRQGFIAALLDVEPEKVRETTLAPTIMDREFEMDKVGILDVLVRMEDGSQMDFEMQVRQYYYWDKRVLFYLSRLYSGQMKRGQKYSVLRRCVHVGILDFTHFPKDTICHRKIQLIDAATGKRYTDLLEIQILELPKVPEGPCGDDRVLAWMKFFNGKSWEEFEEMSQVDEYLKEAYEILEKLSADEEKRMEYEARMRILRDHISFLEGARDEGREEGYVEGHEDGREEGIEIGIERGVALLKKVLHMDQDGKSVEEIAEACGITEEKVRELLAE